ncbi:MAG: DUF2252 family protein [Bryobacteraceae bacterium]|jgi:hypothetical protein
MKIGKATEKYEAWLGRHLCILEADLQLKHEQMRSGAFPFLRATYYRWAQMWAEVCGEAARGPRVLAVGDLHVENFGTWRDIEGRLIWGINDFDEAWRLPYTNDLIRLATSALLAKMTCEPKAGIAAILQGYSDAVEAGGRPFALAEHHVALRTMASARLHQPETFWEKLRALENVKEEPPAGAIKAIDGMMPERGLTWRVAHRVAGLGSLGRQRYVAIAEWGGGSVAREAKAVAPSACVWAEEGKGTAPILYQEILDRSVRCRDPFVRLQKRWIVRRLAPDCSRIELSALPKERDEIRLLHAMGWETANVHLGSIKPRALRADLQKRPRGWLVKAARRMEKAVTADFQDYSTR